MEFQMTGGIQRGERSEGRNCQLHKDTNYGPRIFNSFYRKNILKELK